MSGDEPHTSDGYVAGMRAGVPFALATVVLGIYFGVLSQSLGWGAVAPVLFSILAFSGSAQFAVVAVLGAGGGAVVAVVAAVILNARFLPMGIAVAPYLKGDRWRRALEAQAVIDSSWALASRGKGRFDRAYLIGATVPQAVAWMGGTAIGVAFGDGIGDPERFGLDMVFPVLFLGLLIGELKAGGRRAMIAAALAAILTASLLPVATPGIPVLASCIAASVGLMRPAGRRSS
ncbi:MAG TPA: AzlC family ABC transporter permease [Thermomicrobiales bacterium]|nr:AzlC family ABC transporter permease [Thermomicrobiales bacterium]